MANGCNALEPDITEITCGGQEVLVDFDSDLGVPDCGELRLLAWCDHVNQIAQTNKNLALVAFDIKSWAKASSNGPLILDAARNRLNANGVNLNVIYSTAHTNYGTVFDQMLGQFGPREGVQFDAEDDVGAVMNYFFDRGYTGNIGFGDGSSIMYGPLTRTMDRAAYLRASVGYPRCVTYAATLKLSVSMEHFINAGVDGIIAYAGYEPQLIDIVTNHHPELRLATREDNPFQPLNEAYAVEILTGSDGTDADIEFTLHGCRGNATITVNSGFIIPVFYNTHRFEAGNYDWVTIPSKDLGELQSITINNLGGAAYSQWEVAEIRVSSANYIGPHSYSTTVGAIIPDGAITNLTLTPQFALPPPTIQCPTAQVVPNDPDQCGAVVAFAPEVGGLCDDVTAVCVPLREQCSRLEPRRSYATPQTRRVPPLLPAHLR